MRPGIARMLALFSVVFSFCLVLAQGDLKAEKAKLGRLEKAYVSAKSAWKAKPKSPQLKGAYARATNNLASAVMVSPALDSKAKYPKALRLYREVLKVQPKNAEALKYRDLIESIYRSMNKPIPR